MKIVRISAIWCGSCIQMKNIWKEIEKEYDLDTVSYDIDFDIEAKKYNTGDILPVSIFLNDKGEELERLVGEKTKEEIIKVIEKYKQVK